MYSIHYAIPGEAEKSKVYNRSLALVASQKHYSHFLDYTTESVRMTKRAEEEAKRLAEMKKGTYQMSKDWDNTIENIKKKRKEELLSKKEKEEEERMRFFKEMTAKKEAKHAKVIGEAQKLLFYRKPQCRLINKALFTSECLRELEAQLQFQETLHGFYKQQDDEYARMMREDFKKHEDEERRKSEEREIKRKVYIEELKKQILRNKIDLEESRKKEMKIEKEELMNLAKYLDEQKKYEIEEAKKKKKSLNEIFVKALDEKKQYEFRVKQDEKFQEEAVKIYNEGKQSIEKKLKAQLKKEKDEKLRHTEVIVKRCAMITKSNTGEEELRIKKAEEEREAAENERREARKRHEEKLNFEMENYRQELAIQQEKQRKKEEEQLAWESLQIIKKNEYDKEITRKNYEVERLKKQKVAESLQRQIALKKAEQKRLNSLEVEDSQAIIDQRNEQILRYGEEVLKESEGVRPLFPIIKVIEQFKKEIGLLPVKTQHNPGTPVKKCRRNKRKPVYPKSISESQIFYLQ